ncbi:MAG: glycoside hydrolase family 44 protein [Acidobacteriota bacterium]
MRKSLIAAFCLPGAIILLSVLHPSPSILAASTLSPALAVDAASNRHPISLYIYGMNFADEALAAELRLTVRRWGGNATTRFNWQNDTSNHASDWYFENIPNNNLNPGILPDGSSSDLFVEQDRRTGTRTLLTVPLIGWTPKSRGYDCGFSVSKYGTQTSVDPWRIDCGNGVQPGGPYITGNDPADTSAAITSSYVQDWMRHLIGRYGTAASGGVAFYDLDNEPMLWNDTHRDVHPQPTSYDEMKQRTLDYAVAIKAMDGGAKTFGPAEWGWTGYFYSALDWAAGGSWWNNPVDRKAHGNVPFVEWYLQQMRAYELQSGTRILDYLDLHYYPQGTGIFSTNPGDTSTQALRLRSTRSLWDTTYVDESWINDTVYLIPRMRGWVNADYAGTGIAVGEYNWGALGYLNGALAQADVLGIFGREGLDLATLWDPPTASQPGAFAFRLYRNYDGYGRGFGDVSVRATSTDQDSLAIYAAQRSFDSALTVMVINKTGAPLSASVALTGFTPGSSAQVYRYDANNLNSIVRLPDLPVSGGALGATWPASSITLLVLLPGPGGTTSLHLFLPLLRR